MGKRNHPNDQTQAERFEQTARELGCDEDEAKFNDALKKVAGQKPSKDEPPHKERRPKK